MSAEPVRGRILIIDDSWVMLDGARAALAAGGYNVRLASELEVARRHVATTDLCIVDFHMPGIDGALMVKSLRIDLPADSHCAFYLYTSDPEIARSFGSRGFDGAFLKKGDPAQLATQVDAVFRTIRMRQLAAELKKKRSL